MRSMRSIGLTFLAAGALAAVLALVLGLWGDSREPARADASLVVGYDMNPAGNSCPGTGNTGGTDCTLGSVESCVEVTAGGNFDFDVFIDGLPEGESLAGPDYYVGWFAGLALTINGPEPAGAGEWTLGVNLIADDAGSVFGLSGTSPVGNTVSPHHAAVADLGVAETNPPFTKGVLHRFNATVEATTPAGVYGLFFDPDEDGNGPDEGGPVLMGNKAGDDMCTIYGCELWDANRSPQYGLVAVDTSCEGAVATPVPSPTPSPTLSPTPSPTPAATPTPGGLVAGWNHVCYVGPDRPIGDALAGIEGDVLAVYRLTPISAYDRWFPTRPDLSNITDVTSYGPLFILMASDAAWQQEPADTAPTSMDLVQGWNSVCYSGQTKEIAAATSSIAGKFGVLYVLGAAQGWKRFVPTRPDVSDLSELRQFQALLILVTEAGAQWAFDP
ncbi:MAG: hypothetical protein Q8P22_06715 [Chloroflexota bacterium]|nr:hypothetical protein [Chloroflexota bacterium]